MSDNTDVPYEALLRRRLEAEMEELRERIDLLEEMRLGPLCHLCGRYAGERLNYVCGGCFRLPEHCNCPSRLTAPIEWREIK